MIYRMKFATILTIFLINWVKYQQRNILQTFLITIKQSTYILNIIKNKFISLIYIK